MSKLREQFLVNDRLREYIERMLSVIIENNPQLLEITMNADMPIGITANPRKQSLVVSSTEIENTPVPPEPLKPTKSNDKYCRL
jgi:hypothetical protein